jgi:hypothetical protein
MRGKTKVTWAAFSIGAVWLCGAAGQKLVDQHGRVMAARRTAGGGGDDDEVALPGGAEQPYRRRGKADAAGRGEEEVNHAPNGGVRLLAAAALQREP